MGKKYGAFLMVVLAAVCFYAAPAAFAQSSAPSSSNDELKAKLKDVQERKEQASKDYEAALGQANTECDSNIRQLKAGYKKACKGCNDDCAAQCKKLHEDYNAKMQPLSEEENQIRSQMTPSDKMNFAKPKYERKS